MNRIQVIESEGKAAFFVVPAELWMRVRALVEETSDAVEAERFDENDDGVRIPLEVAFAIAEGSHPVRAWREYRKLTQDQLADRAGLSKPFISQIETGVRVGTMESIKNIAAALNVPVGALA